jgi:hypothetical protein
MRSVTGIFSLNERPEDAREHYCHLAASALTTARRRQPGDPFDGRTVTPNDAKLTAEMERVSLFSDKLGGLTTGNRSK